MDEAKIKRIIQQEISRSQKSSPFNIRSVINHDHDGINSLPVNEDNVVLTQKLKTQIISDESEQFTLRNVSNVSRISFHGFVNEGDAPSTRKASISGEVIFGKCASFTGSGTNIVVNPLSVFGVGDTASFLQASNFTFIDTGSLGNATVGHGPFLAYAASESADVAVLTLDRYENDSLTFTLALETNWRINGQIIIE